jgi:hypothetical protein
VTLPAALNFANSYLIWSEVQYSYKPVIGYVVSGTLTLKDQITCVRGCPTLSRGTRRQTHGIGSAVVDLIFSIAKRDVTFFSGTVPISFL